MAKSVGRVSAGGGVGGRRGGARVVTLRCMEPEGAWAERRGTLSPPPAACSQTSSPVACCCAAPEQPARRGGGAACVKSGASGPSAGTLGAGRARARLRAQQPGGLRGGGAPRLRQAPDGEAPGHVCECRRKCGSVARTRGWRGVARKVEGGAEKCRAATTRGAPPSRLAIWLAAARGPCAWREARCKSARKPDTTRAQPSALAHARAMPNRAARVLSLPLFSAEGSFGR